MKNTFSVVAGLLLSTLCAFAAKPAFSVAYNVGTASGIHAYAYVSTLSDTPTPPKGSVRIGVTWVTDLGPVSGSGTISVPRPDPKFHPAITGQVFFTNPVNVDNTGPYATPVVWISETVTQQHIEVDSFNGTNAVVQHVYDGPVLSITIDMGQYLE